MMEELEAQEASGKNGASRKGGKKAAGKKKAIMMDSEDDDFEIKKPAKGMRNQTLTPK